MADDKLQVVRVPVLEDNYSWLLFDPATQEAGVVDPGEAAPVLAAAKERGWHLTQIWLTHWHPDHVGGVAEIKRAMGSTVTGPRAEKDKIEGARHLGRRGRRHPPRQPQPPR